MITLYCPQCGEMLFKYSENATNQLSIACRKCRILITKLEDGTIKTGDIPKRTTSSGMRFY